MQLLSILHVHMYTAVAPAVSRFVPLTTVAMQFLSLLCACGAHWCCIESGTGMSQSTRAATAIKAHLRALKLPPARRIFSSPLLRCAQTAANIAAGLKLSTVWIEPDLVETICANWYYSWAIPGADSRWGGPNGSHAPKEVFSAEQVRPEALQHFSSLYLSATQLAAHDGALSCVDPSYDAVASAFEHDYRWDQYETDHQTAARVGGFGAARCKEQPDETVILVTHGGPSSLGLEYLAQLEPDSTEVCGYTGLHVLLEPESDRAPWRVLVQGDVAHIADLSDDLGRALSTVVLCVSICGSQACLVSRIWQRFLLAVGVQKRLLGGAASRLLVSYRSIGLYEPLKCQIAMQIRPMKYPVRNNTIG